MTIFSLIISLLVLAGNLTTVTEIEASSSLAFTQTSLKLAGHLIASGTSEYVKINDLKGDNFIKANNTAQPSNAPILYIKPYEILYKIALCESNDRHFNPDGMVLRGLANSDDIGRYQLNLKIWQPTAEKMGLDLFKERDNEIFARWLFEKYGTSPWENSKFCWSKL